MNYPKKKPEIKPPPIIPAVPPLQPEIKPKPDKNRPEQPAPEIIPNPNPEIKPLKEKIKRQTKDK